MAVERVVVSRRPVRDLRPFVFFDKDGTLVEDVPYSVDPAAIRLAPGAGEALRALAAAGYGLAVASNQSGVARGLFAEAALGPYRRELDRLLAAEGVRLDDVAWCPHHPEGVNEYAIDCECRKPAPGMLRAIAARAGADLSRSWMVGDILDDVEAGHRAGCRSVLVDRGHETAWVRGPGREPDTVARDLAEAAGAILSAADVAGIADGQLPPRDDVRDPAGDLTPGGDAPPGRDASTRDEPGVGVSGVPRIGARA